jgi:hypothetical protein
VTSQRRTATSRAKRVNAALVAVFIVCVPLAFSEDFLLVVSELARLEQPPEILLVVDGVLLAAIGVLTNWWIWPSLEVDIGWPVKVWWLVGALLTIALDLSFFWGIAERLNLLSIWGDIAASAAYLASLAVILSAIVGASPLHRLIRDGRAENGRAENGATQDTEWERFRPALPLLVGTAAAYAGSLIWWWLRDQAVAAEQVDGLIHQEYFAQLSQVIPLLLVAVGLEATLFKRLLREPVQREMTIVSVVILCIGEALAISALPTDNERPGNILVTWHEYAAFVLTLEAVFVALALLVWALIDSSGRDELTTDTEPQATPGSAGPAGQVQEI